MPILTRKTKKKKNQAKHYIEHEKYIDDIV